MRSALDLLYRVSGGIAALFLVAICGIVLLQVGANIIDRIASLTTGEAIGLVIPSYAEFAGFFLAASSFFALAYSLRRGSHIRVNLVIQHFTGQRRRWIEIWCVAVAAALSAYFCLFMISLVQESLEFGDVSPGMVAVPLWIPQSAMALGLIVLVIALLDELVGLLRGAEPTYEAASEDLFNDDTPDAGPEPGPGPGGT